MGPNLKYRYGLVSSSNEDPVIEFDTPTEV